MMLISYVEVTSMEQNRVRGNRYRTTIVCVDSYEGGLLSGRLHNPYWSGGKPFQGVLDLLAKQEELLDRMQLPQSFTTHRSFFPWTEQDDRESQVMGLPEGKEATFAIRILFRQNASWQGSLTWMEKGQEESFRSVLELLLMMQSALNGEQAASPAV
jgi:hypothetical protein